MKPLERTDPLRDLMTPPASLRSSRGLGDVYFALLDSERDERREFEEEAAKADPLASRGVG